jgi:DNA-binding MarR family transcriptional regulator
VSALPSPDAEPSHACARGVLASVPPLMQEIRARMREAAPAGLSIPQFRALIFARNHPGASLSELAAHLGITVPTASVAVDRLVRQKLLRAPVSPDNRRRLSLQLTRAGARAVDTAWAATTEAFARRLDGLSSQELALVQQALALLQRQLAPREPGADA